MAVEDVEDAKDDDQAAKDDDEAAKGVLLQLQDQLLNKIQEYENVLEQVKKAQEEDLKVENQCMSVEIGNLKKTEESTIKEIISKNKAYQEQIKVLRDRMEERFLRDATTIEKLRMDIETLNKLVEKKDQFIKELQNEIQSSSVNLIIKESMMNQLELQLKEEEKKKVSIKKERDELKDKKKQLQLQLHVEAEKKVSIEKERDELKDQLKGMEKELVERRALIAQMNAEAIDSNTRIRNLEVNNCWTNCSSVAQTLATFGIFVISCLEFLKK